MQHWKLYEIDTPDGSRSPVVLHSVDGESRVVLIALEPGQELGDHQVTEAALLLVVSGGGTQSSRRRRRCARCRSDLLPLSTRSAAILDPTKRLVLPTLAAVAHGLTTATRPHRAHAFTLLRRPRRPPGTCHRL